MPIDFIRGCRPDFLTAETMRDFPLLRQKAVGYKRLRAGESPLLLEGGLDSLARVYASVESTTRISKLAALLLMAAAWKDLLDENPLGMTSEVLTLHLAALQVLLHSFPKPEVLPVYLAQYLLAFGAIFDRELPRSAEGDRARLLALQGKFALQVASALRPTRFRKATPLQIWWTLKGRSRLTAKLLASMTSDLRELQQLLPGRVLASRSSLVFTAPEDPRLSATSLFFIRHAVGYWQNEPFVGTKLEPDLEYLPTALLPVSIGGNHESAFEQMHKTGLLREVLFSRAGRVSRGKSPIRINEVTVCSPGVTKKLRKFSEYTGYRWTHLNCGVSSNLALISHRKCVNELSTVYSPEKVEAWYRYLYFSRRLLLREDDKLDTDPKLLALFLGLSPELDHSLARCLPSRLQSYRLAISRRPLLSECLRLVNHLPNRSLLRRLVLQPLAPGWTLVDRMSLVKGSIEGVYSASRLQVLLEKAEMQSPESVLLVSRRTLLSGTRRLQQEVADE